MNTDIAQLCRVLRSLLAAARGGNLTKDDYALCEGLLSALEEKYEAGVASLEDPRVPGELAAMVQLQKPTPKKKGES